jgi:hypothetical protein
MNDVIEIHTVGDSCCLYNPRTNFLAVVNRSAKLIAELANAGKSKAEISRHIAARHGEEVAKISRIVNDTLAAIHDEGDGQANPPAIRDFSGHGALFQQGYALPNNRFVRLEIESAEIFGTVSGLVEPYQCPGRDAAAADEPNSSHVIACFGHADSHFIFLDAQCVAYDVTAAFSKRLILEKLMCLSLLPDRPSAILHAAAVETGGKVVMFAGVPGAGKSTLAAYLVSQGAKLVSDDLMGLSQDGLSVSSFAAKSNLKQGSWAALEPFIEGLSGVAPRQIMRLGQKTETKFIDLMVSEADLAWRRVALVLHVAWQDRGACVAERLPPEEHFERLFLSGSTIRKGEEVSPAAMVRFANECPAYELRYSRLPDAGRQIMHLLEGAS